MSETILYRDHPAMFRNRPLLFAVALVLVPVWGLGLLILVPWWIACLGTTLLVTDRRVTLRRGILSRDTSDILLADIRNVQVRQGVLQRLFDVGDLGLSSSGQGGIEIEVAGIPHPRRVAALIDAGRREDRR